MMTMIMMIMVIMVIKVMLMMILGGRILSSILTINDENPDCHR